jgi:hypothetical protein
MLTRPLLQSFWLLLILLASGCSQTSLLTKQDYQKSLNQFMQGNADDAYLDFPRGAESGNFITTMEKPTLTSFRASHRSNFCNSRQMCWKTVRYHVSCEAKTFLSANT